MHLLPPSQWAAAPHILPTLEPQPRLLTSLVGGHVIASLPSSKGPVSYTLGQTINASYCPYALHCHQFNSAVG